MKRSCHVLNIPNKTMAHKLMLSLDGGHTIYLTTAGIQKIDRAFCRRLQAMVTRNALFAVGRLDEH